VIKNIPLLNHISDFNPTPCIFYPHYYSVTQYDALGSSDTVKAPASLQTDINKLIHVRKNYLGGIISVLSEVGNPYPSGDTYNVYVARRQGNGTRDSAIVVLNNHDSQTKGLWVDSSPAGFNNWANTTLVNAFDNTQTITVYGDGRVYVTAPARGYAIWVKQSDYLAFSKQNMGVEEEAVLPQDFNVYNNYPNPFNPSTTISYALPYQSSVELVIYDIMGAKVKSFNIPSQSSGYQSILWDGRNENGNSIASGIYLYRIIFKSLENNETFVKTAKLMLIK
jgi:alpha-amylase